MLRHRRFVLAVLAALLLIYVYNFCSVAPGYGVPAWIRLAPSREVGMNSTLGVSLLPPSPLNHLFL